MIKPNFLSQVKTGENLMAKFELTLQHFYPILDCLKTNTPSIFGGL